MKNKHAWYIYKMHSHLNMQKYDTYFATVT